jgi:hypothetical protein
MFAEARTDGFHAIIRKKIASLMDRVTRSHNSILSELAGRYDCPIVKSWVGQIKGIAHFALL